MSTSLHDHYVQSSNRLLLLDYDGTLVGFAKRPEHAKPSLQLLEVLGSLANDPRSTVVIVSGRDREFLDRELGDLPLGMVAEHGYFIKNAGSSWTQTVEVNSDWKNLLRPVMEAALVEGAFIEEKVSTLVWHYYLAGEAGDLEAIELASRLRPLVEPLQLAITLGHKVVEVRPAGVDKGEAARHWIDGATRDFILAAGDDTTDEDLFEALPPSAFTIKVGTGPSLAGRRVGDHSGVISLLENMLHFV